jgi:hypothetical protein
MATIITKFSDYRIQSIEYFIDQISDALTVRDLPGLTNNTVQAIKPTKQHPLATLMNSYLQNNNQFDVMRSGVIPAISVTPGNMAETGFTLGQSYRAVAVDDDWITDFKALKELSARNRQAEVLLTSDQIDTILAAYKKATEGSVLCQKNEWRKDEDINVSVWSHSPDIDIILGNLLDSIFADIQVGFAGDGSKIMNFKYRVTKGLTNFTFGRILFGSEFNLTFTNTYNNFTIYQEDRITEHDLLGDFTTDGESDE